MYETKDNLIPRAYFLDEKGEPVQGSLLCV
jgi:hypothetical protein